MINSADAAVSNQFAGDPEFLARSLHRTGLQNALVFMHPMPTKHMVRRLPGGFDVMHDGRLHSDGIMAGTYRLRFESFFIPDPFEIRIFELKLLSTHMKKETTTSLVKVERNTTEIISEFDLFISACDGISHENIRYSEWGLSISVTVGQRGCEIERVESMRIGDVLRYKGKNDSLFEVRLMTIDTGDKKSAIFEVSELSSN